MLPNAEECVEVLVRANEFFVYFSVQSLLDLKGIHGLTADSEDTLSLLVGHDPELCLSFLVFWSFRDPYLLDQVSIVYHDLVKRNFSAKLHHQVALVSENAWLDDLEEFLVQSFYSLYEDLLLKDVRLVNGVFRPPLSKFARIKSYKKVLKALLVEDEVQVKLVEASVVLLKACYGDPELPAFYVVNSNVGVVPEESDH